MGPFMTSAARERNLDGRVALVVGGGRNIGAAIATELAARGANIVISYANDDTAAKQTLAALDRYQIGADAIRSDATTSTEVDNLVTGVVTRHGRLDIVVHMPGAVLKKPLIDVTDDDFDHLINLNARSAFFTLRAAGRHLSDGGRYVALSTTLTSIMAGPYGVYAGAKAAVEQLVRAAAKELAGRRITVNAVAPGPVDDTFYHAAETPESVAGATRTNPHGRLGRPDDIAPVVAYLVSDDAAWISGQTIRANGAMF
jgi:3-oxoacyl-[acyl-carrier protein] reductase